MNDAPHPALLPAGLYDLLPPEAEIEAALAAQLMAVLAAHDYERVKPPLVEFEETLLSGAGSAMASDTFRTMDPISHRMIGVRADMTPQVARIAATRLSHRPRPLRLSYAGQVLRVKGSQMQPERQVGQAGAELIGAAGPAACREMRTAVVHRSRAPRRFPPVPAVGVMHNVRMSHSSPKARPPMPESTSPDARKLFPR